MSNINMWRGDVVPVVNAGIEHVESPLAADMQARVQARIAALAVDGRGVFDVALSGSGDGHAFVCALVTNVGAALTDLEVFVYEAASEPDLQAAGQQLLNQLSADGYFIYGQGDAGSAAGHRWMGIILASTSD